MVLEPYNLQTEIIPGILEKEWSEVEKKLEIVRTFSPVVHVDLLDGKFAPNITWTDPSAFVQYTGQITFELHLMVDNPINYLDDWAKSGFKRFIGQIEMMPDTAAFVAKAQGLGEVGLAVDTQTPAEKVFPYIEDLDFAFVMTVKAGFSRQNFMPEMLEKVRKLREKAEFLPIEIDGGVNDKTILEAKKAGTTKFVSTGFLFGDNNPKEQYELLQRLVNNETI